MLHASSVLPGQPGLLFQGHNAINGGNGNPFGNGIRCAGLNVRRLQVLIPDAFGEANNSTSIANAGNHSAGDQRSYQFWYRDPSPSAPCGSTFNLTNSFAISWMPKTIRSRLRRELSEH